MRRPWRACALALTALALGACRTAPPTIGDPPPKLADADAERAYRELLDRYSDTAEVYALFDTHLFSGATYLSWPMREARVKRLGQFKAMTQPEIDARLEQERAEWATHHVFDFGAWTQDPKYDDFDRKDSIWRLALIADGVEVLPAEVERVRRVDHNTRALYPYMGQFWVLYRVKFPKVRPDGTPVLPPGTREVRLRVTSTLGQAELRAQAE